MNRLIRFAGAPSLRRAALALALLALAAARSGAETLPDPTKAGAFPVGVTTTVCVDRTRDDKICGGPRTLVTEIWYPATEESRNLPKNKFSDFMFRGQVKDLDGSLKEFFSEGLAEVDKRFQNKSIRDAQPRDGKFPLIVFSHGNGGVRAQNAYWCEHLASHGYIVLSPDHTGNCAATVVNGKVIRYNPGSMALAAKDRPKDVSFLLDRAEAFARGEDSRFAGRIDLEHIGVAGHSFGGFTSAAIIEKDPRVDAIIPMTPVWPVRTNYTTPVLIYVATEDKTIGAFGNQQVRQRFDESKGPAYFVEVPDGGHFTFTEMFQLNPNFGDGIGKGKRITKPEEEVAYLPMAISYEIAQSYSTAFFGVYLKGQAGYKEFLHANHYGDKIIYKFSEPESQPGGNGSVAGGGGSQ